MAEFTALLAPGIHRLSEADLEQLAVMAFPKSVRRQVLFAHLQLWLSALRATGATGYVWLDGSFMTEKPEPSDIDLVAFPSWAATLPVDVQGRVVALFDQAAVKAQYSLDVYLVNPGQANTVQMTSYWRGWFGFCRDGTTAKGIAEVMI